MRGAGRERRAWWLVCAGYVVVLYATLPLGRPVIDWLRGHYSLAQQAWLMNGVFAGVGVLVVVWLISRWRVLSPLAYVYAALLARLLYCEFRFLVVYPEERLHFLEYGVLACLLHRACAIDVRGGWAYAAAMGLGALIGLGDEVVQHLTKYIPDVCAWVGIAVNPATFRRYFGWSDVALNALGVAYGLAFWAGVVKNRRAAPLVPG
ncbi:MAG: VanZ family protein [bacterium]|nr:VanZ family protein [bacterium]